MDGFGASAVPGWKMPASASTPSTSLGPGRANDAFASTAHTGMPSGSIPSPIIFCASVAAPSRWYPQGAATMTSGALARTSSQVVRADFSPGSPRQLVPPAAATISGTQWPGAKGGSVHSRTSALGFSLPCNGFGDGDEPFAQ